MCLQSGCGFDVDARDHFDNTPLHIAAKVNYWLLPRATSLASMYFIPYQDKYVDGRVMANNPCEFAMKEINLYDQSMRILEWHFLLAMSVGTGIYPLEEGEWTKWFNIKKQLQHVKEMVDMLTQAVSCITK